VKRRPMSQSFQRVLNTDAGNLDRAMTSMRWTGGYIAHSSLGRSLTALGTTYAPDLNAVPTASICVPTMPAPCWSPATPESCRMDRGST
jgi:hypothetical protein